MSSNVSEREGGIEREGEREDDSDSLRYGLCDFSVIVCLPSISELNIIISASGIS